MSHECFSSCNNRVDKIKKSDYYIKKSLREAIGMIYVCVLCGYEYDPKYGDPDSGIAEGPEFDELPADWVCPLCGASKEDFEPVDSDEDEEES